MKLRAFLFISIFAVACTPAPVAQQNERALDPQQTDEFCNGLETSKGTSMPRLFGSLQPDPTRDGTWQSYSTEAQLNKAVESGEVFEHASVWKTDPGILVSTALSSPSGDWVHYVNYCFRGDGTLARSIATFNTFNVADAERSLGPVSRERTRYFDGCGKQVSVRSRILDLKTQAPAPEREGKFMDRDEPEIPRIQSLPFGKLLDSAVLPDPAQQPPPGCSVGG